MYIIYSIYKSQYFHKRHTICNAKPAFNLLGETGYSIHYKNITTLANRETGRIAIQTAISFTYIYVSFLVQTH